MSIPCYSTEAEPKFKHGQRVTFKDLNFWGERCVGVIDSFPNRECPTWNNCPESDKEYVYSGIWICCDGEQIASTSKKESELEASKDKRKGCS